MKKILLLLLLSGTGILNAQTYSYQWAKTGGGNNGSGGVGFNQQVDEHILDIVTDSNNNSYYLTALYGGNPLLNNSSVTHYDGRDLLLFSTDCQGNIRWSQTIGGYGNGGTAQKLGLDSNGGLYLSIGISSLPSAVSTIPTTFGSNNNLPFNDGDPFTPSVAGRYGFLLKYNTLNGNLVWRKDFQGDVSINNGSMDIGPVHVDSQNVVHMILGFKYGTHLNGLITVPSSFDNSTPNHQYYMVKYDESGNIVGVPSLLPLTGSTTFIGGYLNFLYDETNSRYYLGGSRNYEGTGTLGAALSYNNVPIVGSGFLLAFNSSNFNELWRRDFSNTGNLGANFIFGLKKDLVTSDIYLSGKIGRSTNTVTFGNDFTFNTPLTGQISYVMKLSTSNTGSSVLWSAYPTALSNNSVQVALENARMPIAIKGNEILFAKGSIREVWGAYPMVRPLNDRTDPLLVRLNKETGVVNGTYEVQGSYGAEDHFTAVAVDNDNNILLGGYLNQQLFTASNDNIPTISNAPGSSKSNFFIAKLATSANCAGLSTQETSAENAQLSFYPNPAQDYVMVSTKNKLQTFEVYSMTGQLVKKGKFESGADRINVQSLASGNYLIKITTDKGSLSGKMIKK